MKKFLISVLILICGVCFAGEEKTTLRVGISNNSFSTYEHNEAKFITDGTASVMDVASGEIKKDIAPKTPILFSMQNGLFTLFLNGKPEIENVKGPIIITSSDKIGIPDLKRKGIPAYYLGMIELRGTAQDKFNIINIIDIQSYLKGVVPNEMPVSFGIEALKAQAVAARNYANRGTSYNPNYDVCDSVACQVYYGANSQTSVSDRAVDETLGIYALYDNEIILALYSSTASGITEDYFNTFGNFEEEKPYLKSVRDNKQLAKYDDEEYFKKNIPSFDMDSPKYRWIREFDRTELEDILSKNLYQQSKAGNVSPEYGINDKIYGLESIKVLKRGASRKALEVEIISKSGNYVVKKELPIRRVFNGLPSANFIVEKEKESKIKQEEKKDDEIIFQDKSAQKKKLFGKKLPEKFVFYGAGFGHGVGMSQYGAGFLSKYNVPYNKILEHYYTGIKLGTMPKTVSYNPLGTDYVQEFYFTKQKTKLENISKSPLKDELREFSEKNKKPKCYLTIENPNGVSDVEFYINGYYFNQNMGIFKKKILKTEITAYLDEGKNKIVFKPLLEGNKKKTLRFYVTLGDENE